jgi:hypothetical protein
MADAMGTDTDIDNDTVDFNTSNDVSNSETDCSDTEFSIHKQVSGIVSRLSEDGPSHRHGDDSESASRRATQTFMLEDGSEAHSMGINTDSLDETHSFIDDVDFNIDSDTEGKYSV